ncbi:hypothetical protein [Paradevosia shaoguanensis]|uniref:Uncharacterized protein n=1 Tax=Paradevosia shaoguanensis TaxID=1335043 RepID=A0AA41UAC0_9HYPH|nr:hypothetical protein [Paradevosia shaoguanensis]MBI4047106.1 hypothetical protein [Devosia nanyangense]MCF1741740.1 hypothetical protein [Paradevosia shaoguanensis]MCI0126223.1 hypothetical protein [Paradevosia shaoguanensis]
MVKDDGFWAAVRADYEARQVSVEAVAMRHGLTVGKIAYAAKENDWKRRYLKHVKPESSFQRMFRVIEAHLIRLEATEITMETEGSKEVALLGNLCKTLEKLIEIDKARPQAKRNSGNQSKEMTDLTNKLVRRIEQLKRR